MLIDLGYNKKSEFVNLIKTVSSITTVHFNKRIAGNLLRLHQYEYKVFTLAKNPGHLYIYSGFVQARESP